MEDDPQSNQGQRDAEQERKPAKDQNRGGTETKGRVRRRIKAAVIASLLVGFAGFIVSFHTKLALPALGFLWAAVIVMAYQVKIELLNNGATKRASSAFGIAVAVFGTVVCLLLLGFHWQEHKPIPRPEYKLFLETEAGTIELTNSAFRISRDVPFEPTSIRAIVLPANEDGSATLTFTVFNDSNISTPPGTATFTWANLAANTFDWYNAKLHREDGQWDYRTRQLPVPELYRRGRGYTLKPVKVMTLKTNEPGFCTFELSNRDEDILWGFALALASSNIVPEPIIFRVTTNKHVQLPPRPPRPAVTNPSPTKTDEGKPQ